MFTYIWKILVCALSVVIGTVLGGMMFTALGLPGPQMPPAVDARLLAFWTQIGSMVLSIGLAAIARGLRGSFWTRWLIVAWFAYGCLGINNTIEASFFTSIGGGPAMAVLWLVACLLSAGVVALLFRSPAPGESFGESVRRFFGGRTLGQWVLRLAAAWLAFPMVYFLFGTPVGLLVQNAYRDQAFGLRLPGLEVIIAVEFVRSVVFLLGALAIFVAWSGLRRRLSLVFGLSLFTVLGLHSMLQAYWLPWSMRGVHSVEILLDSLVYGWLLVRLLVPRDEPQSTSPAQPVAGAEVGGVAVGSTGLPADRS
jgi:hypothetical protein